MEVTVPILPPKDGYVERSDEQGNRYYEPTKETIEKEYEKQRVDFVQSLVTMLLDITTPEEMSSALEFRRAVQLYTSSITDEATALQIASVYPNYEVGVSYKIGDIFRYGSNSVGDPQLYQVLQDHTSAYQWIPDSSTALYKKIGVSEDGTPIWVQPLGATDAYNTGDQVMYNGKKYESVINANVWAPDAYPAGWKLVEDTATEEPEPEPTPEPEPEEPEVTVPEFVQPSGSHDAYNKGDRVMFEGKVYESVIDGNTWSPSAYPSGWKEVTD